MQQPVLFTFGGEMLTTKSKIVGFLCSPFGREPRPALSLVKKSSTLVAPLIFFDQFHFWKRKIVPCIDRSNGQWGENRSVHHFDQHHGHFQRYFSESFSVFDRKPLNLVWWYSTLCQKNVSRSPKNIGKTGSKYGKGTRRLNQSIHICNEK